MATQVSSITRRSGIAGQISYAATVRYEGEDERTVTFVGSTYGGPVVMLTDAAPDGVFVSDPARFGTFGPEWVRRFFG